MDGSIVENIEACVREGRAPRPGMRYAVKIGDQNLAYQQYEIADPVPTGRQLLEAAGQRPADEHLLFAVLKTGMLEEIRLDETVDLFGRGAERFVAFRGDRAFLFIIDERRFDWGAMTISGRVLKKLAGVDPATHGVWFERRDEPDSFIADDEAVSLSGEGVERFRTGALFCISIEGKESPWFKDTITTEEIATLGGWDASVGVIEVDENQNERQLAAGEVIHLKPGHAYGKKHRWKRG